MSVSSPNTLAAFLRDRRAKLDPASFGFDLGRRRTPGLRREEVAQRANISPTWYTWLEQGRGGAPSADVLDRLAAGMMLTEPEREHLFMLGLGHMPEPRFRRVEGVTPRLQRLLEAMPYSPAIVKTATWDVVAWNKAAAAVLTDYATLAPEQRNILRLVFSDSRVKAAQEDWRTIARHVVGAFRADAARAGVGGEISGLVEELSRTSAEFAELWKDNAIVAHGDGLKRIRHPEAGLLELDFSSFAVEGRSDLGMIVYTAATEETAALVKSLVDRRAARASVA